MPDSRVLSQMSMRNGLKAPKSPIWAFLFPGYYPPFVQAYWGKAKSREDRAVSCRSRRCSGGKPHIEAPNQAHSKATAQQCT